MDHISKAVRQDLELDVSGTLHKPLDVHGIVGKSLDRFHLGVLEIGRKIVFPIGDSHPLSAAAAGRLDHHRKADLFRGLKAFLHSVDRLFASRNHRNARRHHSFSCLGLISHLVNDLS